MSRLLHLVTERRFDEALEHLEANPNDDEVKATDASGRTALQKICQETNPGPDAVTLAQAMLEIRPELIHEGALEGGTLLHSAVRQARNGQPRSTDLALLLISTEPALVSVRQTSLYGFTPFHTACGADADIEVMKAMLQVNPELASCFAFSGDSKTPIEILLRQNGWNMTGEALEKIALILLTNFKGRVVEPLPMNQIVHAVCSYPRPLTFLTRIMKMFPDQVTQPDDVGQLPLHYAVKNVGIWDNSSNPFLHSNFVFQKLMRVVRANPEALLTLDPTDGLYPALMSAIRAEDSKIHLSITYQLLKQAPEMIAQAIVPLENEAEVMEE